jgi:membrane associated rhomboid family serine protease
MVLPLGDIEKTRIVPVATYALMALNIALFFVEQDLGETFQTTYAATPYEITHDVDIDKPFLLHVEPEQVEGLRPVRPDQLIDQGPFPLPGQMWLTVLTAMFLHASPLHLAGNMLFLWIFGDNVEEVLGTFRYVLVYLLCGIAGSLAQILAAPDSLIPTLGASGAIAGLMGAYVVWFPHNRVRVLMFNFLTIMPAYVVIGVWIVLQIVLGYGSVGRLGEVGGVAYLAHIGGAAAGLVVGLLFRDRAIAVQAEAYRDRWPGDY